VFDDHDRTKFLGVLATPDELGIDDRELRLRIATWIEYASLSSITVSSFRRWDVDPLASSCVNVSTRSLDAPAEFPP